MNMSEIPEIFVVATPIGNLGDMTFRGIEILKNADFILAEDTRRTRTLLTHFEIGSKELIAYHDHAEEKKSSQIVDRLVSENLKCALVSDAGTPCISDPGYRLIHEARQRGVKVTPVPGACAFAALWSVCGLRHEKVVFCGFLPTKRKALEDEVSSWSAVRGTFAFYESPNRIQKTLAVIKENFPYATVCVGRELTKLHENYYYGSIDEVTSALEKEPNLKGEVVAMVDLHDAQMEEFDQQGLEQKIKQAVEEGMSSREILELLNTPQLKKKELYQLIQKYK